MAEAISKEEVEKSNEQEAQAAQVFGKEFLDLTEDQASKLSKVLFPESHTSSTKVLEKERKFRPLSIKFSKRIYAELKPFSDAREAAEKSDAVIPLNDEAVEALKLVGLSLAEFYSWDDVTKAIVGEDISVAELQAMALTQSNVNGANDFLLGRLRVLTRLMQVFEISNLKFQNTLDGHSFAKSSPAPLTTSLQTTP